MKIKKGDTVKVISGNYRGKTGKVLKVFQSRNRAIVEGINFVKRHSRPTQNNPQGGIIEREASIHLSNLMLVVWPGRQARRLTSKRDHGEREYQELVQDVCPKTKAAICG
jgi:large subunit ribosomal protein L24